MQALDSLSYAVPFQPAGLPGVATAQERAQEKFHVVLNTFRRNSLLKVAVASYLKCPVRSAPYKKHTRLCPHLQRAQRKYTRPCSLVLKLAATVTRPVPPRAPRAAHGRACSCRRAVLVPFSAWPPCACRGVTRRTSRRQRLSSRARAWRPHACKVTSLSTSMTQTRSTTASGRWRAPPPPTSLPPKS